MIRRKGFIYDWHIKSGHEWIGGRPNIIKIINKLKGRGTIIVGQMDDRNVFILGTQSGYGSINAKYSFVLDHDNNQFTGNCRIINTITVDENKVVDIGNGIGIDEVRKLYLFVEK